MAITPDVGSGYDVAKIVAAGLPGDMSHWLEKQLRGVGVRGVSNVEDAVREVGQGDCSLLILNHTLSGLAALDVLSRVRAQPESSELPVIYLLDKHLDSRTGRELLAQLGVEKPLLNPVDREEVVSQVAKVLKRERVEVEPHLLEVSSGPLAIDSGSSALDRDLDHHTSLLMVEEDVAVAEAISLEASMRGMRVYVAPNADAAFALLQSEQPDAALLDLAFPNVTDDGLRLLKDLNGRVPPIPVLVLTASDTFLDRVQVASLGARRFLQKSLPASEVIDAVAGLIQQLQAGESRVLAVDDDPQVLAKLHALLEPRGIQLTTLQDPLRFWDALEQSAPDLLMLDLDMPRWDGIELCRVVRNDARWSALPVLLLTDSDSPETVGRVFAAGADDFVSKPVLGTELVTKVLNRLERTLLYRSLADIDPMTGVTNRRKSTQTLRQFLKLAERQQQPLSLALLDVDHFKTINDRFGHGTGDAVLQQLGKILMRTFRSEDVVARWGGEEFLVGMYGMNRIDGVQRLADLLEGLRQETIPGPHGERIHLAFSAGVAQFPEDGKDVQSLYKAADDALYRAKASGRNRVLPVGWQVPLGGRTVEAVDVVVVNADRDLGSLIVEGLETKGYQTQWLHDGEDATLLLGGTNPAVRAPVVLLDLDLPDLHGLGVLRRLSRDGGLRGTRVIVLASREDEAEVLRSRDMGVFDYMFKPFSLPVLLQRIRRAIEVL